MKSAHVPRYYILCHDNCDLFITSAFSYPKQSYSQYRIFRSFVSLDSIVGAVLYKTTQYYMWICIFTGLKKMHSVKVIRLYLEFIFRLSNEQFRNSKAHSYMTINVKTYGIAFSRLHKTTCYIFFVQFYSTVKMRLLWEWAWLTCLFFIVELIC